ncbi:MAG TPA: Ig-like domain-containing protein, partial [Vicinamibacterales bacterium]|nr:Ig-like domain-containing protein [Vicinamibacterales bacterium]
MASSVQVGRVGKALLKILVIGAVVVSPQTGYTRSASSAPTLDAPSGVVVRVSTEPQLQEAVRSLQSDTTVLIAPGTYRLTSTLSISGTFANVALRGESGNRDDVVLIGSGMGRASYGDVPYGIWTGGSVQGIEISNLTIRDIYNSAIVFASGTQQPHVYNVHLVDAGAPFIEARADAGPATDNGIVEYSVMEYTTTGRDASTTGGVDVHGGGSWAIRHNLFRNIVGPSWQMAAPAVAAWDGAHDTIAEGNSIVNCSIGIAFGLQDRSGGAIQAGVAGDNSASHTKWGGPVTQVNTRVASGSGSDHRGGVIRNNMISRTNAQSGGQGILVADSPYTQVLNNTVFLSQTYGTPIEYQFAGTHDVVVVNNLLDGVVWARDGATGVEDHNSSGATADLFTDAANGDLHLSPTASSAIDRGITVPNVLDDWDGQPRPNGNAYDIGADEYTAIKASANSNAKALSLKGRVANASGGGLAGVTISLSGSQLQSTITGPSGNYTFSTVASGADYTVTASSSGYSFTPSSLYYGHLTTSQTNGNFVANAAGSNAAPPAITLTSPSSGSTFTAPANISVVANVTAAAGVQKIDFFNGTALIGSSATGSISWSSVPAGSYSLTAVVTDTNGATARSAAVSVTVGGAVGAQLVSPISVTLTSPTSGTTFVAPADVTVGATASAGAGVQKIDFFAGSTLIATATSATASATWSNVQAGTYSVKAVVTDTTGATATSAPASVTVSSSGTVSPLPTPTGDPTTWPLVQASNLVYQGAFRLPGGSDDGNFVFGGQALAYNPANNSLFVEAAAINPQVVGEVTIPATFVNSATLSSLTMATLLQTPKDPTEGHLTGSQTGGSVPAGLAGLLVNNGQLYGAAGIYYDANNELS